jgi:hypothetical protein
MSKVLMADLTEGRVAKAAPVWSDSALAELAESTSADHERYSFLEASVDLNRSSLGRFGRTVLFEDNIYRLPNGSEFIPQPPAGTLGSRNHQYALLTSNQYVKRKRGSVYVRTDGRIFDYACDHNVAEREMFDTGFTIHDLERTGRYAPEVKSRSVLRKRGRKLAWKGK